MEGGGGGGQHRFFVVFAFFPVFAQLESCGCFCILRNLIGINYNIIWKVESLVPFIPLKK